MADVKRYRDSKGHIFSVTAEDAKRYGYTLVKAKADPTDKERLRAQADVDRAGAEQADQGTGEPQGGDGEKARESPPEDKAVKAAPANKGR